MYRYNNDEDGCFQVVVSIFCIIFLSMGIGTMVSKWFNLTHDIFLVGLLALILLIIVGLSLWRLSVFINRWYREQKRKNEFCVHGVRGGETLGLCEECNKEKEGLKRIEEARIRLDNFRKEIKIQAEKLRKSEIIRIKEINLTKKAGLLKLNPYEFEIEVAEMYKKLGYQALRTRGSNDGGKDIVLMKGGTKFIVECKRFDSSKTGVGRPLLMKFYAAIMYEGVKEGFFVTTSYFTEQAKNYAQEVGIIELIDGDQLVELMKRAYPNRFNSNLGKVMCPECGDIVDFHLIPKETTKLCKYGHTVTNNLLFPLVKVNTSLQRVNGQIATTNKLLTGIDPVLIPYRKRDKWGFCTPDKKVVIDCVYTWAMEFSNGLAKVEWNNRCGIINKRGEWIIPSVYDEIVFGWTIVQTQDIIMVLEKGKLGIFNESGKLIISCVYEEIGWVTTDLEGLDYFDLFSEELEKVKMNGKYGFVNLGGRLVAPCIYEEAHDFSDGLARIKMSGKYGFLNMDGQLIIPCIYEEAYNFSEGLAAVRKDDRLGFIDMYGNIIIPCIYEEVGSFHDGFSSAKLNGKWGLIDKAGKLVVSYNYEYMSYSYSSSSFWEVRENGKYGLIDKMGNVIVPCIYENRFYFSKGFAAVKINGRYGLIDTTGKLIAPYVYEYIESTIEGLTKVKQNGKYSFINENGNLISPCIYEEAGDFSSGLARVRKDGKWGFIDKNGTIVIPYISEDSYSSFSEGLAIIRQNHKYGFINYKGKIVIPCIYHRVFNFSEGLAFVRMSEDEYDCGYIDRNGVEYWEN